MEFSENELASMICDNNEDVTDAIFYKYSYIIDMIYNKYKYIIKFLKLEDEEIKQEAFYAFNNAIINYRDELKISLPAFITLCIKRKLYNCIKIAKSNKNLIYLNKISIYDTSEEITSIENFIGDLKYSPENLVLNNINYQDLIDKILISLSPKEKDVFNLYINDFNSNEISKILKISLKQVYNAIQRIREKTKSIIEHY